MSFQIRLVLTLLAGLVVSLYLFYQPIVIVNQNYTVVVAFIITLVWMNVLVQTYYQMVIYNWVKRSKYDHLRRIFKIVFGFYPEKYGIEFTNGKVLDLSSSGVHSKEISVVPSSTMEEILGDYLETQPNIKSICARLRWVHIIKFIKIRMAMPLLTFLLLLGASVSQAQISVGAYVAGTGQVQEDPTYYSIDTETGFTAMLFTEYTIDSVFYIQTGVGYDSHDLNIGPSLKGTALELGFGIVYIEYPWQLRVGPIWKQTWSKGLKMNQWGIQTRVHWKDFFIIVQGGYYDYVETSLSGYLGAGYRISF